MGKKIVGVRKRGKRTFEIRYYDLNGVRQHETIKAETAEDAAKVRETRLGDLARGIAVSSKPHTVRFEELAADVVNDYIVNKHRSLDDIETRFRLHLNPVFGAKKAATINTAAIKAYIVYRQGQSASAGTINRELEAMRRAFNLAVRGGKLLSRPHVPMLREDNVRQGFFTRAEVERLCQYLPKVIAAVTWFAFLTGWRLSEIRGLLWRNVDFVAGEIRLEPGTTKNDEGRTFPMSDELLALLESLTTRAQRTSHARSAGTHMMVSGSMATAITPYVFAIDGRPVGLFRKSWRTACFKAGLPCLIHKETGRPIKALRLFHDLRRSAIRELVRTRGLSEREAMMLTGHKTRSVFDRYSVVSQSDLEGIRRKLNASGGKNGGNSGQQKRENQ